MSLRNEIEHVIELSVAEQQEQDVVEAKRVLEGRGTSLADFETEELLGPLLPKAAALMALMQSYSEENVRRMQTIMYIGRSRESDIKGMHGELARNTPGKVDAVYMILSKCPRGEYLAEGLVIADKAGFDLARDWW